jgi:hypothetical protein
MSVREAAESLQVHLDQFPWLVAVGIGNENGVDTIYAYVTTRAHKELDFLNDGWKGYPVQVHVTGRVRPSERV